MLRCFLRSVLVLVGFQPPNSLPMLPRAHPAMPMFPQTTLPPLDLTRTGWAGAGGPDLESMFMDICVCISVGVGDNTYQTRMAYGQKLLT